MKNKLVKTMVRLLAIAMIAALLLGSVAAYAGNTQTITKSSELAKLVKMGKNKGQEGPISITQGKMVPRLGKSQNIYVITFSGTELVKNQSTDIISDLLSGFNMNNAYYFNAVKVIRANVPRGSNLVLAGTSLGGMIAQQVASNPTIKKEYNVVNTVGFGAPLISPGLCEGTVKRLGDWVDPVPYLSINSFTAPISSILTLSREKSGYKNPIEAHIYSYIQDGVWGKYDAVGVRNGGTKIILDVGTRKFYPAPYLDLSLFR